jgi:excisionase family DNA binding protein
LVLPAGAPIADTGDSNRLQQHQSSALLTAREVAERLSVSSETILRWTRSGELPGFRLPGGALRYRQDALDEWLMERATFRREVSSNPTNVAHPVRYLASSNPPDEEQ